jgi:hypothetical protein
MCDVGFYAPKTNRRTNAKLFFAIGLFLTAQALCALADILDVRERIMRETQLYRASHPEFRAAPKHDFKGKTVPEKALSGMEVPGGVGFGYYFTDSALRWTNSTILDYYIIAPSTMGGNLNYYLYLTSTCRAQLGTEALVSYFGQNSAGFWVFDWSLSNNQWQVGITLPDAHPEYLTIRPDEFANPRQMCHVRNGTFLTGASGGQYSWENRVWLFNFNRVDWDLVYSHVYTTASLNANLFVSGATHGYWGPIVEVFLGDGTYNNLNPAGFDLTRLFQDSNATNSASRWLSAGNSYSLQSPPFEVLTEAVNRGFVAYSGMAPSNTFRIASTTANPSTSRLTMDINTQTGHQYELFSAPAPGGVWTATGPLILGDGTRMQFQVTNNVQAAFFRVRDFYDSGSLYVIVNTNAAGFSLDPSRGIISPEWVAEPDGHHWDKTLVGLAPGTYTLNFSTVPGLPSLPPKTVTVTRANITPLTANYALP